ncbi:U-box domain-containing protein [Cephalotus follicularis]|uniref:U-box domain-containing protein n=1 Tax=Cephalotus follicularis TaxID=3775 RepID=A0A1Q3BIQ2_CEPFO|nr:U-box domain-containing protein [Cephalotus follicularis]
MSSDEISLNAQLVFQNDASRYTLPPKQQRRVESDSPAGPKPVLLNDDAAKMFSSVERGDRHRYFGSSQPDIYTHNRNWDGTGPTDDESDGDDEDEDDMDEDDDDDDDDDDVEEVDDHHHHGNQAPVLLAVDNNNSNNSNDNNNNKNKMNNININSSYNSLSESGATEKIGNGNGNGKPKHHSTFDGNLITPGSNENNHSRMDNLDFGNAVVTVAAEQPDGELYYSHYMQVAAVVADGSNRGGAGGGCGSGQKDLAVENGCGFSGRRDVALFSSESGESLRAILSDPVTGALMDDAMILPCGHSFGSAGIQQVIRMKACCTCSHSVSEDSIAPNLSLRAAVRAFRREEELQIYRSSKRRREKFDQDKGSYGDQTLMDTSRGRGVQFPFAVTDRVIIKGNKRTPQRFVGREAVVTTQCLNGWYVVKTLDNAESVKLQYRSLAKVSDDPSKSMSSKMAPNWL